MKTELLEQPDFSLARVTFERAGESLVAESGAMVARDEGVAMKTAMRGGLWASAKRKLLGGESLFINTFTASAPGQTLYLAAGPEGDTLEVDLQPGEPLFIQSGAFLAAAETVKLDTKWGGAKGFFGAGLFLLKADGPGRILMSAFGAIHKVDVSGPGFICDNEHIVAFTSGLQYDIRKVAGMKGLFFSGEGLVCHFHGQGSLWMQTRNPGRFAAWVHPFRRVQKSNNN
jgi:uncharacterized protein (TIGR00266 family)